MDPVTREELFLAAAAGEHVTLPEPVTREEIFLAAAAGMEVTIPTPVTRKEMFLLKIVEAVRNGGGTSDEEDEPTYQDNITVTDGVMTISELANDPVQSDNVLYIS